MSTAKPASDDAILGVLGSRTAATAAELTAVTGLGRSTVSKGLARLESARRELRAGGGSSAVSLA